MDMEYRCWAFMESHPAHAALPFDAKREAMDVLSWSWTDRLLAPQEQPLHPPFSQAECQELLGLLRSFGDLPQPDTGIQSVVFTRVVSRILLRHNFRPHKPLPLDFVEKRRSLGFFRATGQILVSIVLLDVPYLFNRPPHSPRVDAEGGTSSSSSTGAGMRSVLPFLVVQAAILLSASTTFLLLPELDGRARAIALGSAIVAAGCMISGLVALFRYKAEMADAAAAAPPMITTHSVHHHYHYMNPNMEREGMMPLSTRSIVLSLPLVLLIYALLGFVAAVVVYSYSFTNGGSGARLEDYMRWTALGVLGGVAGVLVTSVVSLR
ncbi:hypothetical protein FB45DRAFT_991204 [Roridomyces roridus]|uniref:Uncharacterized protein n=1 Tax=Roridomyces roridus TaxID=1738132 RepID=A0AAD7BP82_9AGAR|nr:hypothetical protein FB45DRAFT_991204 [Roridomyces roridus]